MPRKFPPSYKEGAAVSDSTETVITAGRGIRFKRNTSDIIPVIDFSPMLSSKLEDRQKIAAELRKTCTEVA